MCSTCEDLIVKLNSTTVNENAKITAVAELMVYKRRAAKFYKKLEEVKKICHEDDSVAAIVCDIMQDFQLPTLPGLGNVLPEKTMALLVLHA